MAISTDYQPLMNTLRQERDELRLRLHLASMELQDKWHDIEHYWDRLSLIMQKAANEADQANTGINHKLASLLSDIETGYQDIKKSLNS